jgi:hypothetical protein
MIASRTSWSAVLAVGLSFAVLSGTSPALAADLPMGIGILHSPAYRYETPCSPQLDKITNGSLQDRWCPKIFGAYQARHDAYASAGGGSYVYSKKSDYYSCDEKDASGRPLIPPNTYAVAC